MRDKKFSPDKKLRAYIIGLALGDGNLSNPNGRAVRLRITCDDKYPILCKTIKSSVQKLLLDNKVSIFNKKGSCKDVSCYSNRWEKILGWKSDKGSKFKQKVKIPSWIFNDKIYIKECLKGLFQTDGSIYKDRGYEMINFVSQISTLALDVLRGIENVGYKANMQELNIGNQIKYTIRISRRTKDFIRDIGLWKK